MEEVVYEDVQYKGKMGTLTLNDELLVYQADAPYKTSVKCSWALIAKRQVCPRSAKQQHFKVVTLSGKTAAFYVKDREVLEEIREDMKQRIETMRHKRQQQQQRQQQKQYQQQRQPAPSHQPPPPSTRSTPSSAPSNPMQQLINLLSFPSSSSLAQRTLLEADDETVTLQQLQRKYAREIRQDATINALQAEIQQYKTKIQQQRVQQHELQKQKMQLERDQFALHENTLRLKQALVEIIHYDDHLDSSNHKSNSLHKKAPRRDYTKAVQKATANTKKPSPGMYTMGAQMNAPSSKNRKMEKEALEMETAICLKMHHQMAMQNQSSLAQKHTLIIKSNLMLAKRELDNGYAQDMQYQMVLEGTQNALSDMYPDIVLRQEVLIERFQTNEDGTVGGTTTTAPGMPQLILSPGAMNIKNRKAALLKSRRPSTTRSDGISDLGESLVNGENNSSTIISKTPPRSDTDDDEDVYIEDEEEKKDNQYHPPARMTTVQSLQQSTLTEMAGVAN